MSAEGGRLAAFLATEWQRLVVTVRSWIEDTADRDAEDIVQDVVVGLFEQGDLAAPVRDLSAYVYRSLRNRVIDLYRSRRTAASLDAPRHGAARGLVELLVDERSDGQEVMERKELREWLFAAVDALPPEQRAVLLATELEGRTYRELSESWDTPIGTLLARRHRAVRRLRAVLAEAHDGGDRR